MIYAFNWQLQSRSTIFEASNEMEVYTAYLVFCKEDENYHHQILRRGSSNFLKRRMMNDDNILMQYNPDLSSKAKLSS